MINKFDRISDQPVTEPEISWHRKEYNTAAGGSMQVFEFRSSNVLEQLLIIFSRMSRTHGAL